MVLCGDGDGLCVGDLIDVLDLVLKDFLEWVNRIGIFFSVLIKILNYLEWFDDFTQIAVSKRDANEKFYIHYFFSYYIMKVEEMHLKFLMNIPLLRNLKINWKKFELRKPRKKSLMSTVI